MTLLVGPGATNQLFTARFREYLETYVPPARSVNQQSTLEALQKNVPAEGQPIPLIYGQCQIGGNYYAMHYKADTRTWTIGYVLCLGEIEEVVKIWLNGEDSAGLTVTTSAHLGTTGQGVQAMMKAAIESDGGPTYTDDLVITDPAGDIGVANLVIQYTDDVFASPPEVIVELKGKKVWNPKTSTTIYSENPGLHFGDWFSSSIYGLGKTVDDTALESLQDYCDDTTGVGETRRTGYYVIDTPLAAAQIIDQMRVYASAFVIERGNLVLLIPDKPETSVMTLTQSDIVEGTLRIKKQDSTELPTVIRAYYTDTSGDVWREVLCNPAKITGVDAGTVPWRESRINLVGCTRHSQAHRECIERLDKLHLSDVDVRWTGFDQMQELEIGDVVTITHPYGLSAKTVRIVALPDQVSPGRWSMRAVEYDALAYDDTVDAGPTINDTVLPNGGVPGAPATLTVTTKWYQTEDKLWHSRFDIAWTAPIDGSLVAHYFIRVTDQSTGDIVHDTVVAGTVFATSTPSLKEGQTYEISVRAEFGGIIGPQILDAETLTANTSAPAIPTGLSGSVRASIVYLDWDEMTNAQYYEVRHNVDGSNWATAVIFDPRRAATTATIDMSLYTGNVRKFMVRAYDSVGNNSNEAELDITITGGNLTVFYQGETADGIPTALAQGDLWYDTDDNNHPYRAAAAGADEITGGEWESVRDGGKNRTFRQATEPTAGMIEGDLWVDTDDDDRLYVYTGTLWVLDKALDLAYVKIITSKQDANFTAVAQNRYPIDTETNGSITMTLPSTPQAGHQVYFFDAEGYFDVESLIIGRNGNRIFELEEDLEVDVRYFSGGLQYVDASIGWVLV